MMTILRQKYIILILLLFSNVSKCHCQSKSSLTEKLAVNKELFNVNIDKAFKETDNLLKEAIETNNVSAKIQLYDRRCKYFYSKLNVNQLIKQAEQLYKVSRENKNIYYQAMANIYLAEGYSINGLHDKAMVYLNENMDITKSTNLNNHPKIFFARVNTLTSLTNLYNDKGEFRKAAENIEEIIKNYDVLKENPEAVKKYQYLNYSNLASCYSHFNIDSALYYVQKSISLQEKDVNDKVYLNNLIVLGKISKEKGAYQHAVNYLETAEKVSKNIGEILNNEEIYTNLIDLYTIQKNDSARLKIELKLKDAKIDQLSSKNNSLHKIISEQENNKNQNRFHLVLIILLVLALISFVITFVIYRRRTNRKDKNHIEEIENLVLHHDDLLEMIKNDDPGYMLAFEKIYPGFSKKLLQIESTLISTEIEFCSLLKLNLSTKKIAQLKFIEVRTVQNKKYRIRKKLHIPAEVDLYNWFLNNV